MSPQSAARSTSPSGVSGKVRRGAFCFAPTAPMAYRQFLESSAYVHKTAGMVPQLAEVVRNGCGRAEMNERFSLVAANIRKRVAQISPELRCGVVVTGAVKEWWRSCNGDEDIVVFLLSDVTNIDSKWITCISRKAPISDVERIFQHLYKFDPTQ